MKKCISGCDHLSLLHCSLEIFVLDSVGLRHILASEAIAPLLVILPLEPEVETNLRKDFTITCSEGPYLSLLLSCETSNFAKVRIQLYLEAQLLELAGGRGGGLGGEPGRGDHHGVLLRVHRVQGGGHLGEQTFDFEI